MHELLENRKEHMYLLKGVDVPNVVVKLIDNPNLAES